MFLKICKVKKKKKKKSLYTRKVCILCKLFPSFLMFQYVMSEIEVFEENKDSNYMFFAVICYSK
jgi:hypothetical protein